MLLYIPVSPFFLADLTDGLIKPAFHFQTLHFFKEDDWIILAG